MKLSHLARTSVLAAGLLFATAAWAQEKPARDDVELDFVVDPNEPIEADKLLHLWGERLALPIFVDQQMAGTLIKFPAKQEKLTWGVFKRLLDFYDIVLDEQDVGGHPVFFAHLRRNLPARVGPPFRLVAPEALDPRSEEIVTTLVPIRHGNGNDIFATVRGLLVRDVNRIGNILYIRGAEQIGIVDYSKNVDYYARIIQALDIPSPDARFAVFSLEHISAEDAAPIVRCLFASDAGTVVTACGATNQLVFRGSEDAVAAVRDLVAKIDVSAGPPPAQFRAPDPSGWQLSWWKLATGFATIAFLGQTVLLRRLRRRSGLVG
jgi:hypothetical protein